jgi:hypothetical protein
VPALTLRHGFEYSSPEENFAPRKWKDGIWKYVPQKEPVPVDNQFNGKISIIPLDELFPRRGEIVSQTCRYLLQKFYEKKASPQFLGVRNLAQTSLQTVCKNLPSVEPPLNVLMNINSAVDFLTLHSYENAMNKSASPNNIDLHVLSYVLKLLDIYSDVYPGIHESFRRKKSLRS